MKLNFSFIVSMLLIVMAAASCTAEPAAPADTPDPAPWEESAVYPVYQSLTDEQKQLYNTVCEAIENHRTDRVLLGEYASREERRAVADTFPLFYRELVFEHPEYFWVDLCSYTLAETDVNGERFTLSLELNYVCDENTADAQRAIFERKTNEILSAAREKDTLFEQVLFVYDAIMESARYDHALSDSNDSADIGRSAYGCLIEGETVCSGYTLAFTYLMQELGVECRAEFNSYAPVSAIVGHVWNYCLLDGEYYYFDLTWDDTGFDAESYKPYLPYSHTYFGLTTDELSRTHFSATDTPAPLCGGTAYNYFIYQEMNVQEYDYDKICDILRSQSESSYAAIRFDSYSDLLHAESDLITNGGIFSVLEGKTDITYSVSKSGLHMYFFYENEGQ